MYMIDGHVTHALDRLEHTMSNGMNSPTRKHVENTHFLSVVFYRKE